jgi:hypothetical protein
MNTKNNQKSTDEKKNKKMFLESIKEKYIDPSTDFGFKLFQEYMRYVEFRKHARDIHNSITFAFEEGEVKGGAKIKKQIVINCCQAGLPIETIAKITDLTTKKITEILEEHRLL